LTETHKIKLCCQWFRQYYCYIVISKSNTFKTSHNAASILCSDNMEKIKWQKSSKHHTKHVHYNVHNTFFATSASHQHILERLCYLHIIPQQHVLTTAVTFRLNRQAEQYRYAKNV